MTVHSPTVRDIKTRGTVGNTVVHMHPSWTWIELSSPLAIQLCLYVELILIFHWMED